MEAYIAVTGNLAIISELRLADKPGHPEASLHASISSSSS